MYLDIEPNDNLAEACMATFNATGPAQAVRTVRLWVKGAWQWCAVTGWQGGGPGPAWLRPIEESGDGPARLLYGGDQGLRIAVVASADAPAPAWSLDDSAQWAEPFIILRPETEFAPLPGLNEPAP